MIIAIASGKGGTGKTTIATSLALSLAGQPGRAAPALIPPLYLDCDVEAPNAHLFLHPVFEERREASILVPQIDHQKCTLCGKCVEVCQYHAIAVLDRKTTVFAQLCHGCGSCTLTCPERAITETRDVIGMLERGKTPSGVDFGRGVLSIGEPMAVPIIRQLKKWVAAEPDQVVILDAPPGSSCPVVETLRGADFGLLVTEPTPFGLHDLKLALQVTRELNIPAGVIINRVQEDAASAGMYLAVDDYCTQQGLPVLMRIPFERKIAEGIAQGKTLVEIDPETAPLFEEMFIQIISARTDAVLLSSSSMQPEERR
jgi:MinD superfamily P-loop ATPase